MITENSTYSKKDNEYYSKIIAELEKECFPEDPWSKEAVKSSLERDDILYLVTFLDGKAISYFLAAASYGTAELYRIGVLPTFRGQGKGERLMKSFLHYLPKDTEKV